MPSRKEWCHSKAAPHQGQTSRQGFPPTPAHKKTPGAPEHHHQASPPTSTRHHGLVVTTTVSSRTVARGLEGGDTRQRRDMGQQQHSRAGGTHLHHRAVVVDRTERQEHTMPTLARSGPDGPVKLRQPCCNTPASPPSQVWRSRRRHLQEAPRPQRLRTAQAHLRPARAHLGPRLPRSWPGDHRRPPLPWSSASRRLRSTPPRHRHPATLDRSRPRSTAARDRKGPDPLSMARGKKGRRRRRRPATSAGGGDGGGVEGGGGGRR